MKERADKDRIYPTFAQVELLDCTCDCVRFVYNSILHWRIDAHDNEQTKINDNKASSYLTDLKKNPAFNWLNDVSSVPLQQAIRHQQTAFKYFFEGRVKSPTFKKKRSSHFHKARKKIARIQAKIADCRRDFTHKLTSQWIKENPLICCESLSVKNMVKNRQVSKAISDGNWHKLVRQLIYKAEWYGRALVQINKWYPSFKRCNCCGIHWRSMCVRVLNV